MFVNLYFSFSPVMATDHHHHDQTVADDDLEGGEEYLDPNDVLAEAPDDEDTYMDDPDGEDEGGGHGAAKDQQGPQEGEDEIVFEDNSIQQFPTHRKSVFAVAVHPTLPIAASGGEDDMGYLWNITDGEQIARLSGHTDSVSSTAFSADGTMIVTGGMDGKVRVWRKIASDPTGKQWEFLTEVVGPDEVMVRSCPQQLFGPQCGILTSTSVATMAPKRECSPSRGK